MIESFFKDLTEINGVEAIIVFDNHKRILDSWRVTQFNPTIFSEMGETFLHIFGMMEFLQSDIHEISVPYDKGIIYARTLPRFYLVIIAKLSVEIPLIRLTANVCLKDAEEHRKYRKMIKKLPDKKFYQIKTTALDDVEKIMLENILEEFNGRK